MAILLPEIDGICAERQEAPATPDDLARVMKQAYDTGTTMIPVGAGTRLALGNLPRSAQLAINLCGLNGITEYEPDNMTVSVLCGTPLFDLQQALKRSNQFLPLDPPHPERATLGGLVAGNSSGPIRFRYGTLRDMLIGVKITFSDGTRTKAGGKLVKNVTGYDMCKLYTGSLGTLGILTELTLKVQPRPEALATALLGYPSLGAALDATQLFLRSQLLPDAMEAWDAAAMRMLTTGTGISPWTLMLCFSEVAAAVDWQLKRLRELAGNTGAEILGVLATRESEELWGRMQSARELPCEGDLALVKCSVLYESMAQAAHRMEDIGRRLASRTALFCHAGNYVLYGRYEWDHKAAAAEDMRRAFRELRQFCSSAGGHAVVEKVRPEVKNGFDVWGFEAPALEIMRRVKKEFDPKELMNPGRFVGGI